MPRDRHCHVRRDKTDGHGADIVTTPSAARTRSWPARRWPRWCANSISTISEWLLPTSRLDRGRPQVLMDSPHRCFIRIAPNPRCSEAGSSQARCVAFWLLSSAGCEQGGAGSPRRDRRKRGSGSCSCWSSTAYRRTVARATALVPKQTGAAPASNPQPRGKGRRPIRPTQGESPSKSAHSGAVGPGWASAWPLVADWSLWR